jgi:hypothetical protein
MGVSSTKSYTQEHIQSVRRLLNKFADALKYKGEVHDQSKLEEPEVYGWAAMDLEEKYDYGSPEYYDKIRRYSEVFKHHYMVNSHHPEHFKNPEYEMTLVDMIEMLCDWFSYKDDMTLNEAINLINDQCKRFKFSKTIKSLLINTYRDYMSSDLCSGIYEKQEKLIADMGLENTDDYYTWENIFKDEQQEEITGNDIDFSSILWWEKKN